MDLGEIAGERKRLGIQLNARQLKAVVSALGQGCNFLVFGLGNDTPFWLEANRNGKTVFVEDNMSWITRVTNKTPDISCCFVNYGTTLLEWQHLLDKPEHLTMQLDGSIRNTKWDVILVDAPNGYEDKNPGRMKSIYEASQLIRNGGHVFAHDCNRQAEMAYTDKYLLANNLVEEIGTLRHYIVKSRL